MNSISDNELILFILSIIAFTVFTFLFSYKWVRLKIVIPPSHYKSNSFAIDMVYCYPMGS